MDSQIEKITTDETDAKSKGRSPLFWALTGIGIVAAFIGTLACGLAFGAGAIFLNQTRVSEVPVAAEAEIDDTATEIEQAEAVEETTETEAAEAEMMEEEETAQQEEPSQPPRVGNPAPAFILNDLDGNEVSLADFKGQPVLINFWATWCGPCEAEMPEIHEAYLEHKDDGFVVLAVDMQEHPDTVRSFIDYYELTFTILIDEDQSVGAKYLARGLPTTYFIDRDGNIAFVYIGQMDTEALNIGLGKILAEEDTHLIPAK